jgi:biotin carboxyl carrier protein
MLSPRLTERAVVAPIMLKRDLLIIESMKMEISVCAPWAGTVADVYVAPGSPVRAGLRVAIIERV